MNKEVKGNKRNGPSYVPEVFRHGSNALDTILKLHRYPNRVNKMSGYFWTVQTVKLD